ncbi:SDR family oxidoreductase [Nocardioides dongxiaopingii]|uniref:SDR family NAD(P)-dependent oxidoreductase n=1 Tax=Nocardioides sp. S-1144 TaxID=2582905 RepID=UPI00110E95C0|nr:SDR family oxidoreductase [Nocardioides sp. S-1144]QCW49630.1 SDR family oxidoreductase [Nocardioides sp. S-1144]
MEQTFAGQVVVVTGGSRGMGREMVHAFAARGADVVIASRKLENCEAVAGEVTAQHDVRALPVAFNVSSWDECDALVETVYAELGRVDVLVNNAGLSPLYPSLTEVSEALFDKVVAVNLRGPFRLTAVIGERMAAGDGGSIINIGSIEAIRPQPLALPYAAAKAGLHTLTEGFARAYGPSVRVNTIQAGAFLTDISENWPDGLREEMEPKIALGRCAEPHEVVGTVLHLAGPGSSYTTGACLRVDGGWQ